MVDKGWKSPKLKQAERKRRSKAKSQRKLRAKAERKRQSKDSQKLNVNEDGWPKDWQNYY